MTANTPAWFVRVDCDWGADGLWDERGAAYNLSAWPLSGPLRQRIRDWQDCFDKREPWEETFDQAAYRAEAEAIGRLIKQELPYVDVVAVDRRVLPDGSLGERVPFPGDRFRDG